MTPMDTEKPSKAAIDSLCGIMHNKEVTKYQVLKTSEFEHWLDRLPPKTKSIMIARLDMISIGHFGDHKRFEGLLELRWMNGIRVYSFFWGTNIVVALHGGNKNGQDRDIKKAKKIRDQVLEGTRTIFEP